MLRLIAICCDPFRDLGAVLTRPRIDLVATSVRPCGDFAATFGWPGCNIAATLRRTRCDFVATPLPSCREPIFSCVVFATLLQPKGDRTATSRCSDLAATWWRPCPDFAATLLRHRCDPVVTELQPRRDLLAMPLRPCCHRMATRSDGGGNRGDDRATGENGGGGEREGGRLLRGRSRGGCLEGPTGRTIRGMRGVVMSLPSPLCMSQVRCS